MKLVEHLEQLDFIHEKQGFLSQGAQLAQDAHRPVFAMNLL